MLSIRSLLVGALAFAASPVMAALTAKDIVTNINILTDKSQKLQQPANSINILNGPLIVIGQGPFPQIILGFQYIIQTATADIVAMQNTEPITNTADADDVFNAFRDFVRVHQQLLNILIGKAGLFTAVPVIGQPVATVLRSLEGVVDTIAYDLIQTVQSRAADLTAEAQSLDRSLSVAINSYEGL